MVSGERVYQAVELPEQASYARSDLWKKRCPHYYPLPPPPGSVRNCHNVISIVVLAPGVFSP